jgi:hypothetical protein
LELIDSEIPVKIDFDGESIVIGIGQVDDGDEINLGQWEHELSNVILWIHIYN